MPQRSRSVITCIRVVALLALVAVALPGCGLLTTDVNLVQDRRVDVEAPGKAARVGLPVTIRWSAHDVAGRTFALFVDRAPIKPGDSFRALAEDEHDDACLQQRGCPDAGWLRNRGVYVTTGRSLTLDTLPDTRDTGRGARDSHEVTIVLMHDGRRDGEAAWSRQFYVDRSGS